MRTSILGSCVTRDAFEFHPDGFQLVGYFARTSWISQAGPGIGADRLNLGGSLSPFAERVVRQDAESAVVSELKRAQPDVLVIDLIDERFRIVPCDRGWITYSPYFAETPTGEELLRHPGAIDLLHDERIRMFAESAEAIGSQLASGLPNTTFAIHRALFAERFSGEDGVQQFASPAAEFARRTNETLRLHYDLLEASLPRSVPLTVAGELHTADAAHKWGLDHFHYVPGYYSTLMAELTRSL